MDQIRNYIDAMFSSLPKTREIIEIKLNMLENMEEKIQIQKACYKTNCFSC